MTEISCHTTISDDDSRYLSSYGWTHIFTEDGREMERNTRWVYDRRSQKLVVLDVQRDNKWREASSQEQLDVLDSIQNGNPECLIDPDAWELYESGAIPEWE